MMVVRKSTLREKGQEPDLERILRDGHAFEFSRYPERLPVPTAEELWSLWKSIGPRLLADFIKARPGCRPWAWWNWESPEDPEFEWPLNVSGAANGPPARNRYEPPDFAQLAYLRRYDLLTADERERLAAMDAAEV